MNIQLKNQKLLDEITLNPNMINEVFLNYSVEDGFRALIYIPETRQYFTHWDTFTTEDNRTLLLGDPLLIDYIDLNNLISDDIVIVSLKNNKLFKKMNLDNIDNKGWVYLLTSSSNLDNGGLENLSDLCKWEELNYEDYLKILKYRPDYINYYKRSKTYDSYNFRVLIELNPETKQHLNF